MKTYRAYVMHRCDGTLESERREYTAPNQKAAKEIAKAFATTYQWKGRDGTQHAGRLVEVREVAP